MTGAVASIARVSLAALRLESKRPLAEMSGPPCAAVNRETALNRHCLKGLPAAWPSGDAALCPRFSILRFVPARGGLYGSAMTGFFSNPRRLLIVTHDLVMTAAAMLAAFLFPFRRHRADAALPLAAGSFFPAFLVYAGMVYWIFKASMPPSGALRPCRTLWNIFRACVTVLALSLLVLDYVLVAPYFYGTFFFGKITILLCWVLQIVSSPQ